ncbi:vWA domain-containing protein [Cohaesibacter haloalkalitolerans]|uniref:vWA domain-containing protein n=1 Tax=Cohaesibacter haloalkalitolerans TaxID=1162980 RepID=UPI0013C495A1|nr:VWA domain-containing protein [Cohaesibacter haloalkalitolerans]
MKGMRLVVLVTLWLVFAGLVGVIGYLSLKACGIRFWGYGVSWCSAEEMPDNGRLDDLQQQLHTLMQLNGEEAARCEPEMPEPPKAQLPETQPEAPPVTDPTRQCLRPEDKGYIVLALDHSSSMALPSDIDSALATKLEKRMAAGGVLGSAALLVYEGLKKKPGHKRLDALKESVAEVAGQLDPDTDIGVVAFSGCDDVLDMGNYSHDRRGRMIQKINQLSADQSTAAAKALNLAIQKVKRNGGGRIILVSDGKDSCDGDPCAVARQNPDIEIDVVSLGGEEALACVANATGGKWLEPKQLGQNLQDVLVDLGNKGARQECQ